MLFRSLTFSSAAMQLRTLFFGALVASASALGAKKKLTLDNNQKVYIQNQPVLGDGAGDGALGVCRELASQHVSNPDAPAVKVCGTGIKATFFLRGRCAAYYEHSREIGKCDKGMAPSTCDAFSPAEDPRFGHYQSYLIEQCPP